MIKPIEKAGKIVSVPADPGFYLKYLKASPFFPRIESLSSKINSLIPESGIAFRFNEERFFEAAGLCVYAHRDQRRKTSNLPYADHPITLVEREVGILHVTDPEELIAGLLHDIIEDTEFDLAFVLERFGPGVARLVDGMTKIEQFERDKSINAQNIDKFVAALSSDIRVLRLKMVDRGVNLEDAEQMGDESRKRNCQEALDLYVPLGWLCGFGKAARHLADVALKKSRPERYLEVSESIKEMLERNEALLMDLRGEIARKFNEAVTQELPPEIINTMEGRSYLERKKAGLQVLAKPRTVYEVDQIATMRRTDAHQLSDIVMMQVMVDSEKDCYLMAEIIHSQGTPIDRYWRDYVKDPKINGYQSIHTAILKGEAIIRFQIRTHRMQTRAQEGVLNDAYTPSGEFNQPGFSWLKTDLLRMILGVPDRKEKIALLQSLSQARLVSVLINGPSMGPLCLEVLVPRGVTPLEIAFIADPLAGLCLVRSFHHNICCDLNKPFDKGIGVLKLQLSGEFQHRDYADLLKDPLARLRFMNYLASMNKSSKREFFENILKSELAASFLDSEGIAQFTPKGVDTVLRKMAEGSIPASRAATAIRNIIKRAEDGTLVVQRLTIEATRKKLEELFSAMRLVFPIERYGFEGNRMKVSVPLKNKIQLHQYAAFLHKLQRRNGVAVVSSDYIEPPIIHDPAAFSPDAFYYSHDLALKAAQALQKQNGDIIDIYLNPLAMDIAPDNFRFGIDEVIGQHIATASILFISGLQWDIDYLHEQLRKLLASHRANYPLVVLYERKAMYQTESMAVPLRELAPFPTLSIIDLGHKLDFVADRLIERFSKEK